MKNQMLILSRKIVSYPYIKKPFLYLLSWQCSPFFLLRWLGNLLLFPIFFILKDNYYKLVIFLLKPSEPIPWGRLSSRICPEKFFLQAIRGDKTITEDIYSKFLKVIYFNANEQFEWARRFMEIGRLDLAKIGFEDLLHKERQYFSPQLQLQTYRHLGAVCFMLGKNDDAATYWRLGGQIRRTLFKPQTPKKYRILGPAWFAAIGHVAMLDYYLKYKKLYYPDHTIVAQWDLSQTPGADLFHKFSMLNIKVLPIGKIETDYNKWAKKNNAPTWNKLSSSEKAALTDDFWEYDFPDGEILGYAHAAARIQKEWEAASHPPLFALSLEEKKWINDYLVNLGIPKDAWYVCLHVREAGYHKQWNMLYPSMRDADIIDYYPAIEKIVEAGGWVIRMGDSSMKPLPPMPQVIDYAHSILKTPIADILLAANCKFFLGTNSGFATIGIIYGVPCALTNWVPIGWPLWPSQDLMIFKLFREKKTKRYLALAEIFERQLAFIQNKNDLPIDIELIDNTPEEIVNLTTEILYSNNAQMPLTAHAQYTQVQAQYEQIAKQYGAFTGSQLAKSFIDKYTHLFNAETNLIESEKGDQPIWHVQSNDNMRVTLN